MGLPTPTPHRRRSTREEPADSFDEPWAVPAPAQDQHAAVQDRPAAAPAQQAQPERVVRKEPKMPVYQQGEDIEDYLLRFERMARTWAWPERDWACRLVPLLTGKALAAYTAMDEEKSNTYKHLREAILEKFDVTAETYRQRFRTPTTPPGETPTETYNRLKNLYRRWIKPEQHSKEDIAETIIMEQLINVLPYDVRTWVKEHEPKDAKTTAKLAMQSQTKGGLEPLPDLCSSLYQGGSKGPRKTRQQRRIAKHLGTPVAKPETTALKADGLWEVPENMGALQTGDVSLKPLFDRVNGKGGDQCARKQVLCGERIEYLCTHYL
ncbi:zinc finger and SCAN domain-containing protein 26-like [Engraulis encrasicolus]|uniref:zinc finger and SCAN domain-containing protein 26-like n=1 Tax=Engraulis encrasicolus TaxID=184585 RepID=UPI002FD62700